MTKGKVTILCSGVALGVYIPAMLINYQLSEAGVPTDVVVLESLISNEKRKKINENKLAFHKNFNVALMGQKMAGDIRPNLDEQLIEKLFMNWKEEKRTDFIVFSGFWMPILEDYIVKMGSQVLDVDLCHMDADISTSWKNYKHICEKYNHIWLFSNEKKCLSYEISVTDFLPVHYEERSDRYVIHGGGWGMGTYLGKISELEDKGLSLDIIVYEVDEIRNNSPRNRYFMVKPDWSPWHKNSNGEHEFPYFGEVMKDGSGVFKNKKSHHELFDLIRYSKAIISKPGGSTLMDSLSSATPIILLDSFGEYEEKNAELWEYLGYGIAYDKWRDTGYSTEVIENLHNNLLNARKNLKNYGRTYAAQYKYKA